MYSPLICFGCVMQNGFASHVGNVPGMMFVTWSYEPSPPTCVYLSALSGALPELDVCACTRLFGESTAALFGAGDEPLLGGEPEFEFEVEEEGEEGDAEWLDAAAATELWLEIALALASALLGVAAALDTVAGSLGGGTLHLRPVDAAAARVENAVRSVRVRRILAWNLRVARRAGYEGVTVEAEGVCLWKYCW